MRASTKTAHIPSNDQKSETEIRLLNAAKQEFSENGLHGARVDNIARLAGINKQLIYYHFGNKDGLYLAVLESIYTDIRYKESQLNLSNLDPVKAMQKLVEFTFDYLNDNRDFVLLLTNENLLKAQHLRRSENLADIRSPLVELVGQTLNRGVASGQFRQHIDAVQLYISIAGICFFYFGNQHTLSTLFDQDLESPEAIRERREHVVSFVMHALGVRS